MYGSEFEFNKDRPAPIIKALCALKSSELRFSNHLAASLRNIGFKSCLADPDLWIRIVLSTSNTHYTT